MEIPNWKVALVSISIFFQVLLIGVTALLKINTPIHKMIVIYIILVLIGSVLNLVSIGLNICLLEWIGKFGFFFTSRLIQLMISIEILISLYRPGMDKQKRKKIRIVMYIISLLYGLLNVSLPPLIQIVKFNSYNNIDDNNISICYEFKPNLSMLTFEILPFSLFTLFALLSFIISFFRTKQISKANNKNRRSRIIFYATMVLATGFTRLGSLPDQFYFLTNPEIPLTITITSAIFLHFEIILVFLACCINNSIIPRVYRKIFPKPNFKNSPFYKPNGKNISNNSNPSIDKYSLGSFSDLKIELPV